TWRRTLPSVGAANQPDAREITKSTSPQPPTGRGLGRFVALSPCHTGIFAGWTTRRASIILMGGVARMPRTRKATFAGFALPLALRVCACGGRGGARPATEPSPQAIDTWERPQRMSDAHPAERLDRPGEPARTQEPDDCGDDCDRTEGPDSQEPAGEAGGVSVRLQSGMTLYSLSRTYQ